MVTNDSEIKVLLPRQKYNGLIIAFSFAVRPQSICDGENIVLSSLLHCTMFSPHLRNHSNTRSYNITYVVTAIIIVFKHRLYSVYTVSLVLGEIESGNSTLLLALCWMRFGYRNKNILNQTFGPPHSSWTAVFALYITFPEHK